MANNNPNFKSNLIPFQKGQDDRRNYGGRPRKFLTKLKDFGYKKEEVVTTLEVLFFCTVKELEEVKKSPDATALEAIVASALLADHKNGTLFAASMVFDRIMGKAREIKEEKVEKGVEIITPGDEEAGLE